MALLAAYIAGVLTPVLILWLALWLADRETDAFEEALRDMDDGPAGADHHERKRP